MTLYVYNRDTKRLYSIIENVKTIHYVGSEFIVDGKRFFIGTYRFEIK